MNNYSLIEKLKILMNMIVSSPLFLFCLMFGVALLIFYIISIKKEKNINKWIFIGIWCFLLLILIIVYNSLFISILDTLLDKAFMALYFPDATIYIGILLITNITFIYSLFRKNKMYKIINFITSLILDIFLIVIVNIIKINSISIYNSINLYTNSDLLVLLELSSGIFISWILICLFVSAHNKLKKYDKKEKPEIVFEEV